jgi:hypothetical protein
MKNRNTLVQPVWVQKIKFRTFLQHQICSACLFLGYLIRRHIRWRNVLPKRLLIFNGLHGVISQKIKFFKIMLLAALIPSIAWKDPGFKSWIGSQLYWLGILSAGMFRSIEKIHLIGTWSRDLPACSVVPKTKTVQRAPFLKKLLAQNLCFKLNLCTITQQEVPAVPSGPNWSAPPPPHYTN